MVDAAFIVESDSVGYSDVRGVLASLSVPEDSPLSDGLPEAGVASIPSGAKVVIRGHPGEVGSEAVEAIESELSVLGEVSTTVAPEQFACEECDATFDTPQALGGHMASHSD